MEGQGLSGYLDGTVTIPTEEKAKATLNQNNSDVVTWILNSTDSSIVLSFQASSTALDM